MAWSNCIGCHTVYGFWTLLNHIYQMLFHLSAHPATTFRFGDLGIDVIEHFMFITALSSQESMQVSERPPDTRKPTKKSSETTPIIMFMLEIMFVFHCLFRAKNRLQVNCASVLEDFPLIFLFYTLCTKRAFVD